MNPCPGSAPRAMSLGARKGGTAEAQDEIDHHAGNHTSTGNKEAEDGHPPALCFVSSVASLRGAAARFVVQHPAGPLADGGALPGGNAVGGGEPAKVVLQV